MNVGVRKKTRSPSFWFGQFDAVCLEIMSVDNFGEFFGRLFAYLFVFLLICLGDIPAEVSSRQLTILVCSLEDRNEKIDFW